MSRRVLTWLTAMGTVAALVVPQVGAARGASRPDLVTSKGSVRVANGLLGGSFVVRNAGRARAGRSSASLRVRASGRNRVLRRFGVGSLRTSRSRTVRVSVRVPGGLPAGALPVTVCADSFGKVRESSETNNCRRVGTIRVPGGGASPKVTAPVAFAKDTVFTLDSPQGRYWIYVPSAYDASHATPITLLVWSHGCGGESSGDIFTVSPGGGQSYISIAVGGREGECWNPNTDQSKLLAAIADVESHFRIDRQRVILGGYSSGGDLSYRLAFYHSRMFAGVLAENTSPFRDTGSSQADSLAAATFKFHVVHLAHTGDEAYPIAGVRQETDALAAAGFPVTRIERPGTHYDADTDTTGTDHDLRTVLLPHIDDGWRSP